MIIKSEILPGVWTYDYPQTHSHTEYQVWDTWGDQADPDNPPKYGIHYHCVVEDCGYSCNRWGDTVDDQLENAVARFAAKQKI